MMTRTPDRPMGSTVNPSAMIVGRCISCWGLALTFGLINLRTWRRIVEIKKRTAEMVRKSKIVLGDGRPTKLGGDTAKEAHKL